MIFPVRADIRAEILQILFGEGDTGLLERAAQAVGQHGSGGVIQVDSSTGVAVHPAQDLLDQLAVGVQFFLVLDLGADQNLGFPGDLLHGNLTRHLAFERRTDLLHGRFLGEAEPDLGTPLEVDSLAHTLHSDTD